MSYSPGADSGSAVRQSRKAFDGEPQGTPVPSHVHVVLRQFRVTVRLQVRNARPVSVPHAAVISSAQTLGLHGRVAVATETRAVTPRTAAANVAIGFIRPLSLTGAVEHPTQRF